MKRKRKNKRSQFQKKIKDLEGQTYLDIILKNMKPNLRRPTMYHVSKDVYKRKGRRIDNKED